MTTVRDGLASARGRCTQWLKRDLTPTWRYVFNLGPTMQHRRDPAQLGAQARRVVEDLARHGIARTTLADLLDDDTALARLQERSSELLSGQADEIAARRRFLAGQGERPAALKPYLVELLGEQPEVDPRDPFVRLVRHQQVAGVAETYCGMALQIRDLNCWLNLVTSGQAESSQLWHRDRPEDHSIVKIFVNLDEVTDTAGPLEYVRGSHRGRLRRERFAGAHDGLADRLDDDAIAARTAAHDRVRTTGPAGTVHFADTRGLHRGGHATTSDRLVLQGLYASRSSVRYRVLRPAPGVDRAELSDFALADAPAVPA